MASFRLTNVELSRSLERDVNDMCESHVKTTTETVAAQVESLAPVVTGRFAGSIWSTVRKQASLWTGYVGSDDPARHLIEFGGARTPTYAPFRRAVESVGLRLGR